MRVLSIDVETFSSVDLGQTGVYRYVEAPDFEILIFAYSVDGGPVEVVDLKQGEELPPEIMKALTNPAVIKSAFNANFERVTIAKHFGIPTPPEQWQCTMVHSMMLGLPASLDGVGKALRLDVQKDSAGKRLIQYFSVPCKPTKVNGGRTRNLPEHDPERWEQFKEYCRRDVEVEIEIRKRLSKYPIPESEQRLWEIDQKINDRGFMVDFDLAEKAVEADRLHREKLIREAIELTGIENPNSVQQLKDWLEETEGVEVDSLDKKAVAELKNDVSPTGRRLLEIRQELGKTSVKKYEAIMRAVCSDHRVRGLFQFYGANRTGRWAGRLVQVQNLPRNDIDDIEVARDLLKSGAYEDIDMLFGSLPDVLSQLIRTAFIAPPGKKLLVCDYSAIEARVIAWLAGEEWRLDVFRTHGKIYEASASQMFGVPIEQITKGSELRQKGKVAELALGYQGGPGALISMGALDMGLSEDELPELVTAWRRSNPKIVKFWRDVEEAAIRAVKDKRPVKLQYNIAFIPESGILFLQLPSGRRLAYARPRLEIDDRFGKECITYMGEKSRLKTYGGKLVENIVQATARDCLAEAMARLDGAGYDIVAHVHDEIIAEGDQDIKEMEAIMSEPIPWAPGLPLRADGFETEFYRKD